MKIPEMRKFVADVLFPNRWTLGVFACLVGIGAVCGCAVQPTVASGGANSAFAITKSSDGSALSKSTPRPMPRLQPIPVATLQAQDTIENNPPDSTPQFSLRGFTPDASRILISKDEAGKQINEFSSEIITSFDLVDLNTGAVKPLSKIQTDADFSFVSLSSKAATHVKSAPAKTDGPEPWMAFSLLSEAPPPKDVLRSLTPEEVSGRMVYAASVALSGTGDNTQWGTFVVLRRFGKGANAVQSFAVEARDSDVFLPQWSPDGRRVLFNVGGEGNRTDTFLIHIWNTQSGRIEQGPRQYATYLHPRWSPDSARIAYIVGGNTDGENEFLARVPTKLYVYDVATGKSRVLVTAVSGSESSLAHFRWLDAKSLLYANYVLPEAVTKAKGKARRRALLALQPDDIRPAIFQVAATGGAPTLVVRNGFRPIPSPDGRWIAFFGWPDANDVLATFLNNSQNPLSGPRLFLWERATKRRFLLSPDITWNDTQMIWTPDSARLVLLQSSYNSQKARGTARISTVQVG